jgi:superfamily II DNA or RNA helicase
MEEIELNENSEKIDYVYETNITFKEHQLAIIKKCIEIENFNICGCGIMNDKPGTGKTYCILGLIYYLKKTNDDNQYLENKTNIIVVPQNIIYQWEKEIQSFTDGGLTYKKFIDYSDILDLYNPDTNLFQYDILLTTSLYYNVIATTIKSNYLNVSRVIFDEIDSIQSFVINEISANFIWFVSASFKYEQMGVYTKKLNKDLFPFIKCKCNDGYIDAVLSMEEPNVNKIICKNIYFDNIFDGIISVEEFRLLNALDFTKLNKKFYNKVAQNEKEAIEFLVKDKIEIIEMEELRIIDLNQSLEKTGDEEKKNELQKQLEKSTKMLDESKKKLDLIKARLVENNCCPLCYNEFDPTQNKAISPCCKNVICYDCTIRWYDIKINIPDNLQKCIYCNQENVKFEDFVIIKPDKDNICAICDKNYENEDDKNYATCCSNISCNLCLKDWYHKLLKNYCLHCNQPNILYEDFKNSKRHEEMRINEQNGIKYLKKTKLEFIEYFIRTKILSGAKVIFCSDHVKIFDEIKKIFKTYGIKYIELDDGNIHGLNESIKEYVEKDTSALLLNSNFFGCGLNLQCSTDILFLHKTEITLEKQVVGRAQRPGRKNRLNLWYLMHENENVYVVENNKKIFEVSTFDDIIIESFDEINIDGPEINSYTLI